MNSDDNRVVVVVVRYPFYDVMARCVDGKTELWNSGNGKVLSGVVGVVLLECEMIMKYCFGHIDGLDPYRYTFDENRMSKNEVSV